jgi:hypothetical protein
MDNPDVPNAELHAALENLDLDKETAKTRKYFVNKQWIYPFLELSRVDNPKKLDPRPMQLLLKHFLAKDDGKCFPKTLIS